MGAHLPEDGGVGQRRAEEGHVVTGSDRDLVEGALGAALLQLHHHEGVQEIGGDHVGHEGGVLVLEDDGHDVVADVALPLKLWGHGDMMGVWEGVGCCHPPVPPWTPQKTPGVPRQPLRLLDAPPVLRDASGTLAHNGHPQTPMGALAAPAPQR